MFGLFKSKVQEEIVAPIKGTVVNSAEVPDPTFAEEMLGKGVAIIPSEGKVYAPCDGTVSLVFDTKHAISFTSEKGAEILVHVGLDTVELKGEFYTALVNTGDTVKKGDQVLEFDMEKISAAGYKLITPVVVCNTDDYKEIKTLTGKDKNIGETIIELM